MCLIPILVGFVNVYDGITCSMTLFEVLEPINEVQEVLIPIKRNAKITLNMSNSTDPDETPCFAASHLGLRCLQMLAF